MSEKEAVGVDVTFVVGTPGATITIDQDSTEIGVLTVGESGKAHTSLKPGLYSFLLELGDRNQILTKQIKPKSSETIKLQFGKIAEHHVSSEGHEGVFPIFKIFFAVIFLGLVGLGVMLYSDKTLDFETFNFLQKEEVIEVDTTPVFVEPVYETRIHELLENDVLLGEELSAQGRVIFVNGVPAGELFFDQKVLDSQGHSIFFVLKSGRGFRKDKIYNITGRLVKYEGVKYLSVTKNIIEVGDAP
ncbi:hypothetical protein GOV04_05275 [Candidatus Woesearchaeota archaeon]|nr:hypothetical protein [Candidatus Woesearchaeota archaeon]